MSEERFYQTPIGYLILTCGTDGSLQTSRFSQTDERKTPLTGPLFEQLEGFFCERRPFMGDWVKGIKGTPFQKRVWRALCAIPFGETRSYGEIAYEIGSPKAARAVGGACGKNPLSVFIPCHRAVHSSPKSAPHYAWGAARKEWLLEHEQK